MAIIMSIEINAVWME